MSENRKYVIINDLLYPEETISSACDFENLPMDKTDEAIQAVINAIGDYSREEMEEGFAVLKSKCGIICPQEMGEKIVACANKLMETPNIRDPKHMEALKEYENVFNEPGLFASRSIPLTLMFHYFPNGDYRRSEVIFSGVVDTEKFCFRLRELGFDITMTNHGTYFNKEDTQIEGNTIDYYKDGFIRTYDDFIEKGVKKYNGVEGIKIRLNPMYVNKFEELLKNNGPRTSIL